MECLTGDDRCAEILSLQVTSISWNHSDRGFVLWETPGNKKASCCCWKNHHKTLLRTIISGANQQSWCCSGNRVTPAGEEFKTGVKNLHIDFQPPRCHDQWKRTGSYSTRASSHRWRDT